MTSAVVEDRATWRELIDMYARPDDRRSLWQMFNTMIPYLGLWVLMFLSLDGPYWVTLLLAVPAAGLLVRLFIQFHDCGHRSFLSSERAMVWWGRITGLLTFTPFFDWTYAHAVHHASAGDLDRRGTGDVITLTVDEWLALPPKKRLGYRLYRNPVVLFLLGPIYQFLIGNRFWGPDASPRAKRSVLLTDLALAGLVTLMALTIGIGPYLLIQLPIIWLAGMAGMWLFYVQHQFEGVYWSRHQGWDYLTAALDGSSYYELPKVLQWFTGNIGLHHIHHLAPRIPNYRLQACHDENPLFQIEPVTLRRSFKSLAYRLYDEQAARLVGFGAALRSPRVEQAVEEEGAAG